MKIIIVSGYNCDDCEDFINNDLKIETEQCFDNYPIFNKLKCPENSLHYTEIRTYLDKYLFEYAKNFKILSIITFSDFVFTYIRRLVAEERIDYKDVETYFIEQNGNVINIEITPKNGLSVWPVGFGDGMEIELCKILKARKNVK